MPSRPEEGQARPRLSRARVVDAALALIDEQGMASVTMRAVASRLSVDVMSLYRHIDNRDTLFDAVVDRIVDELSLDEAVSRDAKEGWRAYLGAVARGVRRYARGHPHAFPLVATRPTQAPWINPPLRSLEWIEAFLRTLHNEGFTDDQVLFAYRTFNGFLLGFLLLETSAMAVHDPRPGDGSYAPAEGNVNDVAIAPEVAVPGALTPTRTKKDHQDVSNAETSKDFLDPQDRVGEESYPMIHRLAPGLAEDHFDAEFEAGLAHMLRQIQENLA